MNERIEKYLERVEGQDLESMQKLYLEQICKGVPETYQRFLIGMDENNRRRFAIVAYNLMNVPEGKRDNKFEEIIAEINEAIDDEIRHDEPNVMNLAGIVAAIKDHKELIYKLAENLPERLRKSRENLVKEFPDCKSFGHKQLFEMLASYQY